MKVTVLGGSSPFSASLVDALADAGERLAGSKLMLHGRSGASLGLVHNYAQSRLRDAGWHCAASLEMDEALDGADIVVHQIRYGDLALRADGEELCSRHRVAADETLGPAALLTAIGLLPDLEQTCAALRRWAPRAWVLNLTNPVSSVTAAMCKFGIQRCVGLCELPLVTGQTAARLCRLPPDRVTWTYSGFNHRGFIHSLEYQSRDYLPELPKLLGDKKLLGINADVVERLNAIPLKYFELVLDVGNLPPRRARYLAGLRRRIQSELARSPTRSPAALRHRYLEWYPKSVVPMIVALSNTEPTTQVVNVPREDGVVVEMLADVSLDTVRVHRGRRCTAPVQHWLDIYEKHERSFFRTIFDPTEDRVSETLRCDPVVPQSRVGSIARELLNMVSSRQLP